MKCPGQGQTVNPGLGIKTHSPMFLNTTAYPLGHIAYFPFWVYNTKYQSNARIDDINLLIPPPQNYWPFLCLNQELLLVL